MMFDSINNAADRILCAWLLHNNTVYSVYRLKCLLVCLTHLAETMSEAQPQPKYALYITCNIMHLYMYHLVSILSTSYIKARCFVNSLV